MDPTPDKTESPVAKIRLARLDQLDAVVDLLSKQLREHQLDRGRGQVRNVIERILNEPQLGFVLVALGRDQQMVGVAFGTTFLGVEHGGVSGWIEELYVLPEFRTKGVGSLLIEEFVRIARDQGWHAIDLEVDAEHQRAVPLYQRHDFQPVVRSRYCRKLC